MKLIHKANFVCHKCNLKKYPHQIPDGIYKAMENIYKWNILDYRFFKVYFSSKPMSRLSDFTSRTYKVHLKRYIASYKRTINEHRDIHKF